MIALPSINFDKSKHALLKHRYAIFAAIVVVCLAGLPQIIVRDAIGQDNRGIPFLVNDSEGEYLSRIREVLDGYVGVASPTLFEYKDSFTLIPPTAELFFYALPVKLTGISLSTFIFLSKFLFPGILFFFSYLFISSLLTRDDQEARIAAIAGALLVTIGYDVVNYRELFSTLVHGSGNASGFIWTRLVNPISGGMLLFAYLWMLSRITQEKSGAWIPGFASGAVVLMVGYAFSFSLAVFITILVGLYFVWRKNWKLIKNIVSPIIFSGLIILGVALASFYLRGDGVFVSDPRRAGLFFTHEPLINMVALVTFLGAVFCYIFFFKKETGDEIQKRWWFFSFAVIGASGLIYNQQVITGLAVWPQHYAHYTKVLCLAISVVFLHNLVRFRAQKLWRAILIGLLAISLLLGWRVFEAVSRNAIEKHRELQTFSGVFEYLNANAPKDCVVYVLPAYPSEINRFIPGFTQCNVYHTFYIYSGIPSARVMHNYLLSLRLHDIKSSQIREHVLGEENIYFVTKSYFFRDWNDIFCCRDAWLKKIGDKAEIDRWYNSLEADIELRYSAFLKEDIYAALTRYRIDYFVVEIGNGPQVNESRYPFLSLRGVFGNFAVYAVATTNSY